jgi:hypothetical protein
MNLSEITASEYLAANDYAIGSVWPPLPIERITVADVAVPGKTAKQRKGVIFLKGAGKGWVANKQELRKIGQALGVTTKIETAWLGAWVSLKIVGDVRRPDGTRGNAFRVEAVHAAADYTPPAKGNTAPAATNETKEG